MREWCVNHFGLVSFDVDSEPHIMPRISQNVCGGRWMVLETNFNVQLKSKSIFSCALYLIKIKKTTQHKTHKSQEEALDMLIVIGPKF